MGDWQRAGKHGENCLLSVLITVVNVFLDGQPVARQIIKSLIMIRLFFLLIYLATFYHIDTYLKNIYIVYFYVIFHATKTCGALPQDPL